LGGTLLSQLSTAVGELDADAASQVSGSGSARGGTSSKAVARAVLRETLDAISHTAHSVAFDTPGLDDKFRVPRGHGDQGLLSAARAFAQDAEPIAAQFVAHELPQTFLTNLQARIDALEEAREEQRAARDAHITARRRIEAALEHSLEAVQRLDPIVANKLHDDPVAASVWRTARHVERDPRHENEAVRTAPAPAPSPAPPTNV
jgi:hypothetical protein